MGYNTNIEVYYHKQNDSPTSSHRLAPAPQISINPEFYYANDNVIGYTYGVTINGYANALRKENNSEAVISSFSGTVSHIGDIRDIFNHNGGNLTIKYQNGDDVLVAKGATIKSLNFNESDNKWVNYAPYTVELEFNEIDFTGCNAASPISCNQSIFHSPVQSANSITPDSLIDMREYKIKEFNDKWTFTIENDIYQAYGYENHSTMKVSYTISATGKNYYVDSKTIPAWQQAKNFVQDRLYRQVNKLINSPLTITNNNISACNASLSPTNIHDNGQGTSISQGLDASFGVFNETIKCSTSEAEGSFSVTYDAIIKYGNIHSATHTFTHNIQTSNDDKYETTTTVQGTVKGLTRGGFIKYKQHDFELPQNGQFIITYNSTETRYTNAVSYFNTFIGSATDLSQNFKTSLGFGNNLLGIKNSSSNPSPISYSLDHSYVEGSLTYTATYSSTHERNRQNGFTNVSITRKDPTEIFQEFIIPGRQSGPIIQKLNMYNPRTININIDGANLANRVCGVSNICNATPIIPSSINSLLNTDGSNWIKTKDNRSVNTIDGSYSISLEYTCKGNS